MNKKIISAGLFVLCAALPAMAADWPTNNYMQASTTYGSAATSGHMDGVTSGSVNAVAWYNLTGGYYLPANTATASACPAGSYCPGGAKPVSSTDQGIATCAKGTFSTGTAASCTACNESYTTASTGATAANMCKKAVTLDRFGATGTLTAISGAGTISGNTLTCTQGSNCYLPDASGSVLNGWTFTGGWASSAPGCTDAFTANASAGGATTTFYACAKPTIFTMPLVVIGQNETAGETLSRGTEELYYYLYRKSTAGGSSGLVPTTSGGTLVQEIYKTCTKTGNVCTSLSNQLQANSSASLKITAPTWTGRTFNGYFTQAGGKGTRVISPDGYFDDSLLTSLDTIFDTPYSTEASSHALYAYWDAKINCPAGKFLYGIYSDCVPCGKGYYCDGTGGPHTSSNTGAKVCPSNYYSDSQGSSSCTQCTTGYGISDNGTDYTKHDAASDCTATITLNKNGGSGSLGASNSGTANGTKTCQQGVSCSFPNTSTGDNKLTEAGYTFNGKWSKNANCSDGGATSFTNPTGTYYACKSGVTITINWTGVATSAGGTGNTGAKSTSVTYGGDIVTPAAAMNASVSGKQSFLGWKFAK